MKTKIFGLMMGFLLIGFNGFAADGDLIVNGQLSVGTGGIKFPDGSTQTTAYANTLAWDYTITNSPVTSVTVTALDGNAHGGYEFEFIIKNPTAGRVGYSLFYNNDQTQTDYNYTLLFNGGNMAGNAAYIDPTAPAGRLLVLHGII